MCQELVDAGMIVSLKVGEKKWPEFSDKHTYAPIVTLLEPVVCTNHLLIC